MKITTADDRRLLLIDPEKINACALTVTHSNIRILLHRDTYLFMVTIYFEANILRNKSIKF
jgi:hypothetical protein